MEPEKSGVPKSMSETQTNMVTVIPKWHPHVEGIYWRNGQYTFSDARVMSVLPQARPEHEEHETNAA